MSTFLPFMGNAFLTSAHSNQRCVSTNKARKLHLVSRALILFFYFLFLTTGRVSNLTFNECVFFIVCNSKGTKRFNQVQLILAIYWFSINDAPSAAWRSCKYGRVAVWGNFGVGEFRCVVVDMWGVAV